MEKLEKIESIDVLEKKKLKTSLKTAFRVITTMFMAGVAVKGEAARRPDTALDDQNGEVTKIEVKITDLSESMIGYEYMKELLREGLKDKENFSEEEIKEVLD